MIRILMLLLALLVFGGDRLQAQNGEQQRGNRRSSSGDDGPITLLLGFREELRLGEEQLARIGEINTALDEQNRPLMVRVREIREQIQTLGPEDQMSTEAKSQFQGHVREVRSIMEQMRKNSWSAMEDVGEVLSDRQKRRLGRLIEERADSSRDRQ
jgi:hypothetical protein